MGMTYLLDTHVLLWLLGAPTRIPDDVLARLADPANDLLVSAASAMEVATKTRLGKLPDLGLTSAWDRRVSDIGARELPLTAQAALTAGGFRWEHRDPFDRLLAAQAIHEGAVLVTVDKALAGLTVPQILTW